MIWVENIIFSQKIGWKLKKMTQNIINIEICTKNFKVTNIQI